MDNAVIVKKIRSSRSLRLRVYDDGRVVLTTPYRVSQSRIDSFLAEHADWINDKVRLVAASRQQLTAERDRLFFRGKEYNFRLSVTTIKKPGVSVSGSDLLVTCPSEDHNEVRKILEKFYRNQAEKRFKERVPLLADLVGREVVRVTIRDQRTRWGSCSSRNTISLNWRLIMAPDTASDYVIYHELAHLTHMNHSSRFWRLVEEYCPDYKISEKWLKVHQKLLQF